MKLSELHMPCESKYLPWEIFSLVDVFAWTPEDYKVSKDFYEFFAQTSSKLESIMVKSSRMSILKEMDEKSSRKDINNWKQNV